MPSPLAIQTATEGNFAAATQMVNQLRPNGQLAAKVACIEMELEKLERMINCEQASLFNTRLASTFQPSADFASKQQRHETNLTKHKGKYIGLLSDLNTLS